MTNTVSVSNARKSYGDFTAVHGLSLEVQPGSIFGLLGPNGAGKSSTIRMIVNITMPDSGEIRLFGEKVTPNKKMKIGEQLLFFAELKGLARNEASRRIDTWLERVGMTEWKSKRWEELSKGMQQKIQFVSTILHDPELVILDEPFSGLDPINANLLKEIVHELKRRQKTIIFSTHLMEQAEELCDEIALINRGRKVLSGPLREVKRSFGWRAIAIDGENLNGQIKEHPLVQDVTPMRDHVEVTLQPGADPQILLKDLVAADIRLTRFELVAPSLNEIFIESVKRANAA
jgi:ABC-2 type transport system ATP-binding protein